LIKWFSVADRKEIEFYITDFLSKRKDKKNLIWAPTQVELRTLMIPSINNIEKYFSDYYKYCFGLGFKNRFYTVPPRQIEKDPFVIIDSREQCPLIFKDLKTKILGLKYGDYKLDKEKQDDDLIIERKSAKDFLSSFTEGIERFKRELVRSKEDKSYMVVLVEENLSNLLDFRNKCDGISPNTKITPDYVFRNVRDLLSEEKSIQFLFVSGREEAARVAKNLLVAGDWQTSFDLQLLYDRGFL
jgi:hypothetical protein